MSAPPISLAGVMMFASVPASVKHTDRYGTIGAEG